MRQIANQKAQVVGAGDWSWATALRQLGLREVNCLVEKVGCNQGGSYLKTRIKLEEGAAFLQDHVVPHVGGINITTELREAEVTFGHVRSLAEWKYLMSLLKDHVGIIILSVPRRLRRSVNPRELGGSTVGPWLKSSQVVVGHQALGGLSNSYFKLFCWDRRATAGRSFDFSMPKEPENRLVERFLEPSTRLLEWVHPKVDTKEEMEAEMGDTVWDPRDGQIDLTGMGNRRAPELVYAPTVFLGGRRVVRRLKTKEKGQILDIREDWAATGLADEIWERMREDKHVPLPCRIPTWFLVNNLGLLWPDLQLNEGGSPFTTTDLNAKSKLGESSGELVEGRKDGFLHGVMRGLFTEAADTFNVTVACKPDSAGIDTSLWAIGGTTLAAVQSRETLRRFFHSCWCRRLLIEGYTWLKQDKMKLLQVKGKPGGEWKKAKGEHMQNRLAMCDCLTRCCASNWFEWVDGSRLLFWRWPAVWRREARDGGHIYRRKPTPPKPIARKVAMEKEEKDKLNEKLRKAVHRRYVAHIQRKDVAVGCVYFAVKKGEDDIRVVWSETETGVNGDVYAPNFMLPTHGTLVRRVPVGGWMGDFDVGEMFNNFPLHPKERKYHCVEYPKELQAEFGAEFGWWERLLFGFRPSPYLAVKMMTRALEFAIGDRSDPKNPFWFVSVKLNLPMSDDYDPSHPWVQLLDENGEPASGAVPYIDDGRPYARTEELLLRAIRWLVSRMEWLGIQDAKRKRRPGSQRAGAWAGGVLFTDKGVTRSFLSQVRWDKLRGWIKWLIDTSDELGYLPRKEFLSARGFLVYAAMTYAFMQPYMKGIHLAAEAWRSGRSADGWKLANNKHLTVRGEPTQDDGDEVWFDEDEDQADAEALKEWEEMTSHDRDGDMRGMTLDARADAIPNAPAGRGTSSRRDEDKADGGTDVPEIVPELPILRQHLRSLSELTDSPTPWMVPAYPKRCIKLVYGFGDASGEGFGSAARVFVPGQESDPLLQPARTRRGFWCTEVSERASNYRELRNIQETLIDMDKIEDLTGAEVFLFTDNEVTERVYYKGTSTNELLYNIVTDMRLTTLKRDCTLHVIHIAGTRMIEQGTDGLSRGELQIGSLMDKVAQSVPLHLDPVSRSPALLEWIRDWTGSDELSLPLASPTDWIVTAHSPGFHIWSLPPAAALFALEELGTIPGDGKRCLGWWDWVGRCHHCTKLVTIKDGIFCANFGQHGNGHSSCRHAWCAPCYSTPTSVPFSVSQSKDTDGTVLLVKGDEWRFKRARPGDQLMCPFECEFCQFAKIKHRPPCDESQQDAYLMAYMRRALLDAFWAREPRTVANNLREALSNIAIADEFGFDPFPPIGPWSRRFDHGITNAVTVLRNTLKKGAKEGATKKFSSARKARTPYTNLWAAAPSGGEDSQVWRSERNRMVTTKCPTDSEWYTRFMKGLSFRMGMEVRQDAAISIEVMHELMRLFESDRLDLLTNGADVDGQIADEENSSEMRHLLEAATYAVLTYCASLRGFETPKLLLDCISEFRQPEQRGDIAPHIGLPLVGRFKLRGNAEQKLLLFVAAKTDSGLEPLKWLDLLVEHLSNQGIRNGWLFQDAKGDQRRMAHFEEPIFDRLLRIQTERPDLIAATIDVYEAYGLARSFRRGATTRAQNRGVSGPDVDYINRWGTVIDGPQPYFSGNMRVHYSDLTQMIETFLRFSSAL